MYLRITIATSKMKPVDAIFGTFQPLTNVTPLRICKSPTSASYNVQVFKLGKVVGLQSAILMKMNYFTAALNFLSDCIHITVSHIQ